MSGTSALTWRTPSGRLVRTGQSTVLAELRQHVDLKQLAPRPSVALLHAATAEGDGILAYVRAHPAVAQADLAGALRRRAESVSQVDLVVATHEPSEVLEHLARFPLTAELLERGAERIVLRLAGGLLLSASVVPLPAFAVTLHRLTGSESHLAKLAATARERGMVMDTAGLRRRGRRLVVRSEADIYRHLGLPFDRRRSCGRTQGESRSRRHGAPCRSISSTLADIRGMVHCHTTYSDGSALGRGDGARGRRARHAVPDHHRPLAHRLLRAAASRSIAFAASGTRSPASRRTSRVRLLRGTESDILADGSLDYPDAVLERARRRHRQHSPPSPHGRRSR